MDVPGKFRLTSYPSSQLQYGCLRRMKKVGTLKIVSKIISQAKDDLKGLRVCPCLWENLKQKKLKSKVRKLTLEIKKQEMIALDLVDLVLCLYKMTIWSLLFDHLVKVYGRNFLFGFFFFQDSLSFTDHKQGCLDIKEQNCQHSYSWILSLAAEKSAIQASLPLNLKLWAT